MAYENASPFSHHRAPAMQQVGLQHQANGRESAASLLTSSSENCVHGKRLSHWSHNRWRLSYYAKRNHRILFVAGASLSFCALFVLLYSLLQVSGVAQSIYAVFSRPTSKPEAYLENELVIRSPRVPQKRPFCGLCTEGLVVFGPVSAPASLASAPVATELVVCMETMEEAWLLESNSAPLSTVRSCVARLYNLGLLLPPRAAITTVNDTCAIVRVPVQVLSDESKAADLSKCSSGFMVQLQMSSTDREKVEVHTERFPVWPLCPAVSQEPTNDKDGHRDGSDGNDCRVPAYFATAAVGDTDVDFDVPPPSRMDAVEGLNEVVLRFSRDATQTTESAAVRLTHDLHCPTYFLTVSLGRFGRHHNQLQEILNGISLARKSNRTFILPPFVPALDMPYLKLSPELLYGWNSLRRNGHYCILSYAEARPILQRLRERDGMVSMERVSFKATVDLHVSLRTPEEYDSYVWGTMSRVPGEDGAAVYDADDWFSAGLRRKEKLTAHSSNDQSPAPSLLTFHEARPPRSEECSGFTGTAPSEKETQWERIRRCATAFLHNYGDSDARPESSVASRRQPRIVVVAGITAFHLRPTLKEMTRLAALLRPSPTLTVEIGRYYRLYATQLQWPANTDPKRSFLKVLQPFRFKNTIGVHVRRREYTCRKEVERPSSTIISMSKARYQFDGTSKDDRATAGEHLTTVARLVNDCLWNRWSLLHIYDIYAGWMQSPQAQGLRQVPGSAAPEPSHKQVLRSYVAFDEQVGPIGPQLQASLQERYNPLKKRAANEYLPIFAAFYDHRPSKDLSQTYRGILARGAHLSTSTKHSDAGSVSNVSATRRARDSLVEMLYPIAEQEAIALGFDFFMLSNAAVFRGNVISSVSTNVCLRRWGRGLPCHGVFPGYYEMLYKGYT